MRESPMNQEMPRAISTATVRKGAVADIPAMMSIALATPMASQWSEAQYLDLFAPGPPDRLTLIIEQDSNIAGFLAARCFCEEHEIENIVVSKAQQREGLGTKLLKEFMRITGENHPAKVFLEVRESNMAARALYTKFGFRKTGERKNYYRDPDEAALNYQLLIP